MEKNDIILVIIIIFIISILLTTLLIKMKIFNHGKREVELNIIEQSWTGESKNQPKPIERNIISYEKKIITINNTSFGNYKLRINKIDNNSIEIESIGDILTQFYDGEIDLNNKFKKAILNKGDVMHLSSPTTDEGITIKISVLNIQ